MIDDFERAGPVWPDIIGVAIYAVALFLALVFLFVLFTPARSHDWYPVECCSGQDCRPVSAASVRAGPQGYVLQSSGETVGYGDARIRVSPGEHFHWCNAGGTTRGHTICLFVPQQMF